MREHRLSRVPVLNPRGSDIGSCANFGFAVGVVNARLLYRLTVRAFRMVWCFRVLGVREWRI